MRESRQRKARDGVAIAAALVLHALALTIVGFAERPRVAERAPASSPVEEVPVELDELPFEPPPPNSDERNAGARNDTDSTPAALQAEAFGLEPPHAGPAASAAHVGHDLAKTRDAAPTPNRGEAAPIATAEPPLASLVAPETSAAPPPPAARPIDLGIGADAWTQWLPPSGERTAQVSSARAARQPLVRAPPASSTGGLLEALEAADRARSIGPFGRVVSALEAAAHGDGATAFGVASFAVTVLKSGGVEVRLQSASAGDAEWKRVAERAARDLAANAPRIPPPREGARFVIDLVAEMMLPDGRRTKDLHGPRVDVDAPRLQSWNAGKKDVLEHNPTAASGLTPTEQMRANVDLPGVYVAENGKVCSYRFGLSVLGPLLQGGCELSNIGVKPQRVVHAHVRNQELF